MCYSVYCPGASSSVQFSCSVMSDFLQPHGLQHARPPCLSPTPEVYSNSCPLSLWCHPTISSSVIPFSSCLQSFPASGSFPMSQLFTSGGQSIGVPASASVLLMNIQDWFPLGWTGWISLQFKGLSRVFSSSTVWKLEPPRIAFWWLCVSQEVKVVFTTLSFNLPFPKCFGLDLVYFSGTDFCCWKSDVFYLFASGLSCSIRGLSVPSCGIFCWGAWAL